MLGLMVLPGTANAQTVITVPPAPFPVATGVCVHTPSGALFYGNGGGFDGDCSSPAFGPNVTIKALNFSGGANLNVANGGVQNIGPGGTLNVVGGGQQVVANGGNINVVNGGNINVAGNGGPNAGNINVVDDGEINVANGGNLNIANNGTLNIGPNGAFTAFNGAAISMGDNRVKNVADPTAPTDAANKRYVDQQAGFVQEQVSVVKRQADENTKGVAMAMAMGGGADLRNGESVALSFDWGTFDGENAGAVSGIALLASQSGLNVYGKGSVGFADNDEYGGRAGLQIGW